MNDPVEPITDPDILECLNDPVVLPSPIKTAEERHANPGPLTISFREVLEQLSGPVAQRDSTARDS